MNSLKSFTPEELVFNKEDAHKILSFFFGNVQISANLLTNNDIGFAQGLLLEAVDASNKIGVVEAIWRSFNPNASSFASIAKMVIFFVKNSSTTWWRNKNIKNINDLKIYEMVRVTLARNFKSEWAIRIQVEE